MENRELLDRLIEMLCAERGEPVPPLREAQKPDYFRALCNVRPPLPPSPGFLSLQDEYLSGRAKARGAEDVNKLDYRDNIALYRGDITRLNADAIVDACNSALLGCFHPLHGCIDNAIHSAAGIQVRLGCNEMMRGKEEPNGKVRVTKGYNLPCKYIFHTVCPVCGGPMEVHVRKDGYFVQDKAWYEAADRYENFIAGAAGRRTVLLELGVGYNTPTIIRFPFERLTYREADAVLVRMNRDYPEPLAENRSKTLSFGEDMGKALADLCAACEAAD